MLNVRELDSASSSTPVGSSEDDEASRPAQNSKDKTQQPINDSDTSESVTIVSKTQRRRVFVIDDDDEDDEVTSKISSLDLNKNSALALDNSLNDAENVLDYEGDEGKTVSGVNDIPSIANKDTDSIGKEVETSTSGSTTAGSTGRGRSAGSGSNGRGCGRGRGRGRGKSTPLPTESDLIELVQQKSPVVERKIYNLRTQKK